MTGTQIYNHVYYAVLSLATIASAIPPEVMVIVPVSWKPWVAGAAILGMWRKAYQNLYVNPDGTSARAAWTPPQPSDRD